MSNIKIKHWKGSLTKENLELFRIDLYNLDDDEQFLIFKVKKTDINLFKTPHFIDDFELIGKIEKVIQQHYK